MLKYSPKVFLVFKLPNGTSHQGFLRQSQKLGEIVNTLWAGGRTTVDQGKSIGELELKNDDVIEVREANPKFWPFRR